MKDPNRMIVLPVWSVLVVLVGLPAIYIANSLMPWSVELLRRHNHAFFFQFWCSIAFLHWCSVALIGMLLKRKGSVLKDIGLDLSPLRIALMIGVPVVIGGTLIMLRKMGIDHGSKSPEVVSPFTNGERWFWIFMSFTAGFCEELVYRGFAIRALQGLNIRTWLAILAATLSFVLMHGVSVLTSVPFVIIYVAGLLFSALFIWRRSLIPGIILHTLFDLMSIR